MSFTSPFAPFASPAGSGSPALPFGGETSYGFAIPQGSPAEIEAAAEQAAGLSLGWGFHADDVKTGSQAALGNWRGPAQVAFEDRAGALISALKANSEALGQAADAMLKLSHALEAAQTACKQAAEQCQTEAGALSTAQGVARQHEQEAQDLTQQAAQTLHPAVQSQLMRQAGAAQAKQIDAQNAANAASGRLNDAKQAGLRAENAYSTEAAALTRQIAAAHGQLKALPRSHGAVPAPIPITAADRSLARRLLALASGLPMPKDGNVGKALSRIAGGPLTPGAILALQQDAAGAQRQYRNESTLDRFTNNIVNEVGGFTNFATFGGVSFGNAASTAYKAGEGMAALPIDPEGLAEDASHAAEDAGAHLAEDGGGDAGRSAIGIDRGDGRDIKGQFTGASGYGKNAEAEGLKRYAEATGDPVIDTQVRATIPGEGSRYYDGLSPNGDGTYTGIEVKSNTASPSPSQRSFDSAVSSGEPATATLNGHGIRITRVEYVKVKT